MGRWWWIALGLAVAVAVPMGLYLPSLEAPFYYDDYHSIVWNPHIREVAQWPSYFTDPSTFSFDPSKSMYRPLLLVTMSASYLLGGTDPAFFRLGNWLLHLGVALGVGWMASWWLGNRWWFVAAVFLFLVHPSFSEPAFYLCSRSESLCVLFCWLALIAHLKGRWVLASLSLVGGLLSKETAIMIPLVCGWFDLPGLSPSWSREERIQRLKEYGAMGAVVLGYLAWMFWSGLLNSTLHSPPRPPITQFWTQVGALGYYAASLVFPVRWGLEPRVLEESGPTPMGILILALLILGGVVLILRSRTWFLQVGAMLLTLLPTTLIPLNILAAERRLYWAGGFFVMGILYSIKTRPWLQGLVIVWTLMLGGLLNGRALVWADEGALWKHSREENPTSFRVALNSGNVALVADRYAEAREAYELSLRLARTPTEEAMAWNNLGGMFMLDSHADSALACYLESVRLAPQEADGWANLGVVWAQFANALKGEAKTTHLLGSESYFKKALSLNPNQFQANQGLSWVLLQLKRPDEALRYSQRAQELEANGICRVAPNFNPKQEEFRE